MLSISMMKKNENGFTMIELIVSTIIVGLMVIGVTNLFISIERTQEKTKNIELATRAGERQIESLRNINYTSLVVDSDIDFTDDLPPDLPSPNSGTVSVTEPIAGLKKVDVAISYKDGSATETIRLSSLIGIIGIAQ
jgi:prepilin-type N-terminal cleavage/methylation domain-containing protein